MKEHESICLPAHQALVEYRPLRPFNVQFSLHCNITFAGEVKVIGVVVLVWVILSFA